MSISHFDHFGVPIMFADYKDCKKEAQQLELLEQVAKEMQVQPAKVRLLVSYEGVAGGVGYMNRLKELGKTVFEKHMLCCGVLGITGLKKILFNGYNRATGATNVHTFNSKDEALVWLAEYEDKK